MLHRSTYQPLSPDKLLDKDGSDAQKHFMAKVYDRLGSWVILREMEDLEQENIPQYDPYEDETQNEQSFHQSAEELEPMPEVGDYNVGDEIMLPEGERWQEDI